jgi:hypothetical protein
VVQLINGVYAVAGKTDLVKGPGHRYISRYQLIAVPVCQDHPAIFYSLDMADPGNAALPVGLQAIDNGPEKNTAKEV